MDGALLWGPCIIHNTCADRIGFHLRRLGSRRCPLGQAPFVYGALVSCHIVALIIFQRGSPQCHTPASFNPTLHCYGVDPRLLPKITTGLKTGIRRYAADHVQDHYD